MPGVGGARPGAGRPKGSTNKQSKALKDMILNALERAGGEQYLLGIAQTDPRTFATLLSRALPHDVNARHSGADGGPIEIKWQDK